MKRSIEAALALLIGSGLLFNGVAGGWTDIFRSQPERAEQAYKAKQYDKALELYQEAQTRNPDSDTLAYNLGNTLFQLGRYDEAARQFGKVLEKQTPALAPRSIYNMGNTLFEMGRKSENQQQLSQALEAYKQSITLDSKDEDPKYNYELTRRLIREQEQKQQQQQQNKQDQDKQKQQQPQNQDKQEQQKKNQEQQKQEKMNQQQQQQAQQQEQKDKQQQPPQPNQMSKEEAERILNALMQMEKDMQQKEKDKKTAVQGGRGPDW
ncbi:MAG: hypothetical protein A3F83_01230 [Candidatus Glassbacteria bacterium RIFCSPLOWO2_12_FULL_58_11]|uniref:Uncharacterized protein n=2 Tax=Candidatus Glassiibacteriota TaxID=1817805 RepID=A0A1F5YQI5_9BACT|nr:MAG: hypothetical protein A2Z86_10575 [Candidatus Glassbacteria bacterium GWA2_58_10]OGG02460.1 MAG: hypothetical protein A3F83_01230 [Candidatus Glassbacteria bacterium RIFCSPLOWO2_12_FULL_58_11]